MAAALNKRMQVRNERVLQELIQTVPGNAVCADCGARTPGWASWSLGIFLCMRCATLHRKLGTHISKVKSLSMDRWDNAHVENMKRIGNTESNKAYNPRNVKPQLPVDVDEVDGAMERHIRQKYEQRVFMTESRPNTRSNTGSTSSVEDRPPPPLPPKPLSRFGLGTIKKLAPHRHHNSQPISPQSSGLSDHDTSPPRVNKASRVFGSHVNMSGDGLESKLSTLREMGFPDDKRNTQVLKGLNGNLDRAVEALIRLGEQNHAKSRGNTPTPPTKTPTSSNPNGLSFDNVPTASTASTSTNPFDALDAIAPLPPSQPLAGSLQTQQIPEANVAQHTYSPSNPFNPFLSQAQGLQHQQQNLPHQQSQFAQSNPFGHPPDALAHSLSSLQLSQPSQQPLFPNRTGGHGQSQPSFTPTNPFAQSFTPPPMPQMPPQYGSFYQPPQTYQSLQTPASPGNPFLRSAPSQMFTPTNTSASNPFDHSARQHQLQQHPQAQSGQPQSHAANPFFAQQQQQSQTPIMHTPNPYQAQSYMQPQQQNYSASQGPFDKRSILNLYNYPQLAPLRQEQSQSPTVESTTRSPQSNAAGGERPFAAVAGSAPAPLANSLSAQTPGIRHVSNESVDFAGLTGGRHSPDAFSGLSSSFRR